MSRVIRQVFLVVSYGPVIELNIWNFGNPWWSLPILVNPCQSLLVVINPLNPCEFLSLGADNKMTTWQDNKVTYIRMDIPHKVKQWIIFIACRKHRCRWKLLQSARFLLAFPCAFQSCTKHIMPPTAFPRTKKFTRIFNRLSIRTTAKGAFKWVMINYI